MPNAFNFSSSPFDCLTSDEKRLVRDSVDVVYFRQDTTILDQGIEPSHLFILIKGFVTEYDGDDIVTTYGPNDSFDGRALIAGKRITALSPRKKWWRINWNGKRFKS